MLSSFHGYVVRTYRLARNSRHTNRGQMWVFGLGPSAGPPAAVFDGLVSQPYPLKWIWRMTGSGPLRIFAIAPSGMHVNPVWGPSRHTGSNWVHPGGEWGTGWFFWERGCWRIHATRGTQTGVRGLRPRTLTAKRRPHSRSESEAFA